MPLPAAEAICEVIDGWRDEVVGRSPGFGMERFLVVLGKRRIEGSLISQAGACLSVARPDGNGGEKGGAPKNASRGATLPHKGSCLRT
ncbi:MAG: hypothetical protein Q7R39_12400 [Dehalococcoidia bacterium]|nr:hypothetical protein [Dehalococcoidia bacterium]